MLSIKKQKGFSILAIILVIVAVVSAIGVYAASGESNIDSLKGSTDIMGSALINDAVNIQNSYNQLILNGTNPSSIVFIPNTASTPTAPNILDPTNGIVSNGVNSNIVRSGAAVTEGMWVLNNTGFGLASGLGTSQTDPALLMVGIKDSVCKEINYNLYGSTTIPSFGSPSLPSPSTMITGATVANPMSNYPFSSTQAAFANWMRGCVRLGNKADWNMYFHVLKVN